MQLQLYDITNNASSFSLSNLIKMVCINELRLQKKNSSGDEIANVNFFLSHRTCRGQRLRPLNEFVISTKHLAYATYLPIKPSFRMDSSVQPASHHKWTHPLLSLQETHQETWA